MHPVISTNSKVTCVRTNKCLNIYTSSSFNIGLYLYREYTHIDESGLYDIRIEKCFGMIISLNEEEHNDVTLESNTTECSELSTSELNSYVKPGLLL